MRARFTILGKTLFPALNVRTNTNTQVPWPRVTGFLSENPAGASPQGFLSSRRAAGPQRFLEELVVDWLLRYLVSNKVFLIIRKENRT